MDDAKDWRANMNADDRFKVLNMIFNDTKKCYPFAPDVELEQMALICEEKTFSTAMNWEDYIFRISRRMLNVENRSQTSGEANSSPSNSSCVREYHPDPVSYGMQSQQCNKGISLPISMGHFTQGEQRPLSHHIQNANASAGVQCPSCPSVLSSVNNVTQTSVPNVSGISPNSFCNSVGQCVPSSMFSNPPRPHGPHHHLQSQNARQYIHQHAQGSIYQQNQQFSAQQLTQVTQQSFLSIMSTQPDETNVQQNQLLVQLNSVSDRDHHQQQHQHQHQHKPRQSLGQTNNMSKMLQQQKQLVCQTNCVARPQWLGYQSNVSGLQLQQQLMLGPQPGLSNMQPHQQSMPCLHQQQQTRPTSSTLLSAQGQESQPQSSQQKLMSHLHSQPTQLQEPFGPDLIQRDTNQRIQTSCAFLQSQNVIEQQKQLFPLQKVHPEASSSSMDSILPTPTRHLSIVDGYDEVYKKFKLMKEMYLPVLTTLHKKFVRLQQIAMPERLQFNVKKYRFYLEYFIWILHRSEINIPREDLKEYLDTFKKKVTALFDVCLHNGFRQSGDLRPQPQVQPTSVSSLQHGSMPSLSTHLGTPAVQPNIINTMVSSTLPDDPEQHISRVFKHSSVGNVDQTKGDITSSQTQSLVLDTPEMSTSSLLEEFASPACNEGTTSAIISAKPSKTEQAEQPIERLIKVVKSVSAKSLSASIHDFGLAICTADRMGGSTLGNGHRATFDGNLEATEKCHFNSSEVPVNAVSSDDSMNNRFKHSAGLEIHELESTQNPSRIKRPRVQVNNELLKDIKEINQQLINTVVNISDEEGDLTAAIAEGGQGTIVRCSFRSLAQMFPVLSVWLLVSTEYPKCSPILLDNSPVEPTENWTISKEYEDLLVSAKLWFDKALSVLSKPVSLKEIARNWDACARAAILKYAQQNGGGSFSSRYGTWEKCA